MTLVERPLGEASQAGAAERDVESPPCPKICLGTPALILGLILVAALALRAAFLLGPYGVLEADEAIVGLMARHILAGERPLFYWGQQYLGTLEPFTAAALFALTGASTLALKAVPAAYSLLYLVLSYLLARRLFGSGPALLTAGYLALPPFFLALWSTKPRGGYIEFMALGEATLLAALWASRPGSRLLVRAPVVLALGALTAWTHPLGVVYALPSIVYLALRRRRDVPLWAMAGTALVALVAGALFMRAYLANRLPGMPGPLEGLEIAEAPMNVARLLRIGGAVLVGLAQGTTSTTMFEADWPTRPGSSYLVTLMLGVMVVFLVARYGRSLLAVLRRDADERSSGPALLLGVLLLTPLIIGLTSFGQRILIIEPRYALPLYSVVPLAAAEVWRLRRHAAVFAAVLVAVLGLNVNSWLSVDPRLNLPSTIGATTPATRAELMDWLEQAGLTRVYTNYWIGYPLTFDSQERIITSVISDGFNRFIPYAYEVFISERPAWVFVAGGGEEAAFEAKLKEKGATWKHSTVSIYSVYYDVSPLDQIRP